MSNVITMAVVVGAAAIGVAVLKAKLAGTEGAAGKFKAKPLLTANELEFLARLEAAVPELRFCPQVAMGALLDPAVPRSDRKAYYRLRGMFSQKIVDFVAQARSDGSIVAIIELDDRTHESEKDSKRDAMLVIAGYRVVRWNSRSKPDAAAIRGALSPKSTEPAVGDLAAASHRRPTAQA
ncbi:DUF2726 domain-containing protein [Ramlibacter sp.]|uniref:DUF2726 domain-containing protein n=1 Tax=Ramlibacter sp. TaxID=1917967 RepID=UPI002C3DF339|nr:DUF2726 domain-containing protein [Ramlibacter sp.]HWI81747.1 DUF2726 domain-containing protein [Ramlibacter sp.]